MHKRRVRRFAAGVALTVPLLTGAQSGFVLPPDAIATWNEIAARASSILAAR